jgi:hypothetical protein
MDGQFLSPFRSIQSTIVAWLGAYAIACAGLLAFAQTGVTMIPIETMTVGAPPSEFNFARTGQGSVGAWSVVTDATGAGGRAIEQTETDATDYRFPLAVYRPLLVRDVDVTLRFKAVEGKVDRAGGIAVRLSDTDNYYVVRANALEDNVRFYRVVQGRREQLEGADLKVTANEWHQLGLRVVGDRFAISFDGRALFTASDKTFAEPGRIALWTKADSVTRFDSIAISLLP